MGARAWVVALSLLLPSVSFCADPPPAPAASDKPFHVSFFGEGGGDLKTPVGGAADYLENSRGGGQKARPAKPAKPAAGQTAPPPQAAAAPAVRKVPAGASPMLARAVPKAPVARVAVAKAPEARLERSSSRPAPPNSPAYSLWKSVSEPLEMSSARIQRSDLEQAERQARQEYERRILGLETVVQPEASGPEREAAPDAKRAGASKPELFVSVDLAVNQNDLKDAVAQLTQVTGFKPDPRFIPRPSDLSGQAAGPEAAATIVRGWLRADRLQAAIQAPGVRRVRIGREGFPVESASSRASLVVGLRVPRRGNVAQAIQKSLSELASSAQFRWRRTIGFEAVPHSGGVALVVVGDLPLSLLPRLLEYPDVLKVAPAPNDAAAAAPARPRGGLLEFFAYVRHRAPWLLVATALLLLPFLAALLARLASVLSPYR